MYENCICCRCNNNSNTAAVKGSDILSYISLFVVALNYNIEDNVFTLTQKTWKKLGEC